MLFSCFPALPAATKHLRDLRYAAAGRIRRLSDMTGFARLERTIFLDISAPSIPMRCNKMELSKGGFEAKKGGVLSGFVDLTGKTGRLDRPEFTLGISLLSVHGQFQTPIVTDKMSIIGSYRRSFQTPLFNKILKTTQAGPTLHEEGPAPPANGAAPRGISGKTGCVLQQSAFIGFLRWQRQVSVEGIPGSDIDGVLLYGQAMRWITHRTLQLPAQFLQMLKDRGVDLAARGIDISNPNLNITDLRVTARHGNWQWNGRHVSIHGLAQAYRSAGSLFRRSSRSIVPGWQQYQSCSGRQPDSRPESARGRLRCRRGQKHIRNRHRVHRERLSIWIPVCSTTADQFFRPDNDSSGPGPERRRHRSNQCAVRAGPIHSGQSCPAHSRRACDNLQSNR